MFEVIEKIRGEMNGISATLREDVELTEKVRRASGFLISCSDAFNTERAHLTGPFGDETHKMRDWRENGNHVVHVAHKTRNRLFENLCCRRATLSLYKTCRSDAIASLTTSGAKQDEPGATELLKGFVGVGNPAPSDPPGRKWF